MIIYWRLPLWKEIIMTDEENNYWSQLQRTFPNANKESQFIPTKRNRIAKYRNWSLMLMISCSRTITNHSHRIYYFQTSYKVTITGLYTHFIWWKITSHQKGPWGCTQNCWTMEPTFDSQIFYRTPVAFERGVSFLIWRTYELMSNW